MICSNLQLCSTKQQKIVQSQGFHPGTYINKAHTIDRGIKHKASGHHDFWRDKLAAWTASMPLVRASKDHILYTYLNLHYKSHITLTRVYSQIVAEPGSSMKQLSPVSRDENDCQVFWTKCGSFCFFAPLVGFFRLISGIFARVFRWLKMILENCCPSLSQNRPCPYQRSSARHRKIWTTQCVTPMPLLRKGPRHVSLGFWVAFYHRLFTQNYTISSLVDSSS